MNVPYLHFAEQYFEKIWGGRKLREMYGKEAPEGAPVGEAWLVSDHPSAVSVVDEGPFEGRNLHELLEEHSEALLGSLAAPTMHGRFPLLLKVLDAAEHLSVQVHPDDATARRLGEPDVGKTEMWHVLQADPGSELICGLDTEVDPAAFAELVDAGGIENAMNRFEVEAGTSVFVAAGTVHAIGGGIVLAEIQQNSDITYRIYDWGRVQDNGKPRELHVNKSKEAIHFGSPHGGCVKPLSYIAPNGAQRTVLAACRYFAAELVRVKGRLSHCAEGKSFRIVLSKTGGLRVQGREVSEAEALLIPASTHECTVEGDGEYLLYYVPDLRHDVIAPLVAACHPCEDIIRLGGDPEYSDLNID